VLEDEITIGIEGNHDVLVPQASSVLVPQASSDWEAASVIHVQPTERVHRDADLIGWHIHGIWGSGRQCLRCQGSGQFGLGQLNILALLGKMS
jgi:hypothetical protein